MIVRAAGPAPFQLAVLTQHAPLVLEHSAMAALVQRRPARPKARPEPLTATSATRANAW